MIISNTTKLFISEIEQFTQRRLKFKLKIEYLIQLSENEDVKIIFEELIFIAKFISNTHRLLNRAGIGNFDTEKLLNEYKINIQKASSLLTEIISNAPNDVRDEFLLINRFNSYKDLENFLEFMNELSWIKNYYLDKKTIGE